MPDRLIREGFLSSETLGQLSDFAERLFWRLVVIADDFGRFRAGAALILHRCFPTVPDAKLSRIEKALVELEGIDAIRLYTADNKSFGYFPNFERANKRRANKPKFPDPPAFDGMPPDELRRQPSLATVSDGLGPCSTTNTNTNTNTRSDPDPDPSIVGLRRRAESDLDGAEMSGETSETSPSEYPAEAVVASGAAGAEGLPIPAAEMLPAIEVVSFDEFYERIYPRRTHRKEGEKAWNRLSMANRRLAVEDVRRRIAPGGDWFRADENFLPHPASYLNGERWTDKALARPLLSRPAQAELMKPTSGTLAIAGFIERHKARAP
jgi:hypothetical protein